MTTLLIGLALAALLLVIFEEIIHIDKAKSTLFIGTLSWLLVYMFGLHGLPAHEITDKLNENLLEIASLWLFLMAAMTFVAYLNSHGFIANIVQHILPKSLHERSLMLLLGAFAFVFSSLADNVTATLVSLAIITSLNVESRKRLKYATLVVFAVNSGGVSLITGDITTLMIFLAGKVTITNLLLLVVPALCGVTTLALLLSLKLNGRVHFEVTPQPIDYKDKVIAGVFLTTIICTLAFNVLFHTPPVLTFLFGLSCMFLIGHLMHRKESSPDVLNYIREIEFDTLLFFLGVLLIVGMLKEIGVLTHITQLYELMPVATANFLLGISSALIDNVPLTAALLKADIEMSDAEWLAVTYATGVGGSLLIIGSAAGIIAMSKVKDLSFLSYLSMFFYLLAAYGVGYGLSLVAGRHFLAG